MKRLVFLVIALCLMLTACGKEPKPQILEPMTTEDLSAVYADWSKLSDHEAEAPKLSYYEPRSENGHLKAQNDYGILMTYLGSISGDNDKYLYGLITSDSQIVTEPVYDEISYLGDFIILRKLEKGEVFYEEWDYSATVLFNDYTIAAPDGSWVHELGMNNDNYFYTYSFPYSLVDDDLLFYVRDDMSAILLNAMGEIVQDISSSVIFDNLGENVRMNSLSCKAISENIVCLYDYDSGYDFESYNKFYVDLINGTILTEAPQMDEVSAVSSTSSETTSSSAPDVGSYDDIRWTCDKLTDEEYYYGVTITETDYYYEYTYDLLDRDGSPIIKDCLYWMAENGRIGAIRNGYFCYYSIETGELVFSYPIRSDLD